MPESIIELITGGEEMQQQHSPMIKSQKQEITQYQVFIDEEIGEPKKYRDLISSLYAAGPHDIFNIMICSIGDNDS